MDNLETWKLQRQACRTNLMHLCHVLGYKDVSLRVHGPLMRNLQPFKGGVDEIQTRQMANLKENQVALNNARAIREAYKPHVPDFWSLTGIRKRLNMIPRGHLKTTVATVAHSIQWIINYPNVRILIFTHSDGKAKDFLGMIKDHFTQNENFRFLFPEHVPWGKKVNDFGNQEKFDTCARTQWKDQGHTLQFLTIDSAKAGGHFDVIKIDDAVDDTNVITVDRIAGVKKSVAALEPLVEKKDSTDGGQRGWMDLTGTFYDFSDLNYETYEIEKEKPEEKRLWALNVQSAAPNYPEGPYLWPERFGYKILRDIEEDPRAGPSVLAAQYLMNPVPPGTGLIDSEDEIVWKPRKFLNELMPRLIVDVAVDLAGMDETAKNFNKNDYTALTVGGIGNRRLYILECIHGRPNPQQVINSMFDLYERYNRKIRFFKMEKEAHARVLLPFLRAEQGRRGITLPIRALPRDNQVAKTQKLKGLQPWFKLGMIQFADDMPCRFHLKNEIMRFPKYKDDILDTIYDLMSDAKGEASAEMMGDEQKDFSVEGSKDAMYQEFIEAVEGNQEQAEGTFAIY